MRSIQTSLTYSLSSVKPLDGLLGYRTFCIDTVKRALAEGGRQRTKSPIHGAPLIPAGQIEGLTYGRCPETGSLFLMDLPAADRWEKVLGAVVRYRQAPKGFHTAVSGSRAENVYAPKLDWIQTTLRLQEVRRPTILEVASVPSDFTTLLTDSGFFQNVETISETALAHSGGTGQVDAAILLEALDRSDDPQALIKAAHRRIAQNGLIFITALVTSGFDFCVLGLNNRYLCPPDRTNSFSLQGLEAFIKEAGFQLLEVSTPGILDVEIVQAHLKHDPDIKLSPFERQLLSSDDDTRHRFQAFLQERGLSSFARIVGRKIA